MHINDEVCKQQKQNPVTIVFGLSSILSKWYTLVDVDFIFRNQIEIKISILWKKNSML